MTIYTLSIGLAVLVAACAPRAASDASRPTRASQDEVGKRQTGERSAQPAESAADASASGSGTALEIEVWPAGQRRAERIDYTLTCEPAGGTHPSPVKACAALEKLGARAFAAVPADRMCTQQYGGPMQARVRGVVGGQRVDARLAYTDGCQIARWDRVAAVVPLPPDKPR